MAESVGSVYVEVRPDARMWAERLRADLRDVTVTVPVDADTTEAKRKIDELGAKSPDVKVDVDDTAAATKLAALQAQVDELNGKTADVKVKTGKSDVGKATSLLEKFSSTLGFIPALAIAAGAALIPVTAAVGGLAAALAAPVLFAGGGVGLFAVLGGLAVKDTEKSLKAISKLQGSLDGLKKGSKEYLAVQKQIKQATDGLSPAQKKLGDAQTALQTSFSKLTQGKTGDALLGPIAQGMTVLAQILPRLQPIITAVSGALSDMLGSVSKAASGPGFAKFIGDISKQIGPDLKAFGSIIGDVALGVGNLLNVFGKRMSGGLLDQLERMGSAFADWSSSKEGRKDVRDFIGYVQDVGPQVGHIFGQIADAFVQIGKGLAPLAPGVLHALGGAATAIASIDPQALTTLAEVVLGLTAFNKLGGFKALGALSRGHRGRRRWWSGQQGARRARRAKSLRREHARRRHARTRRTGRRTCSYRSTGHPGHPRRTARPVQEGAGRSLALGVYALIAAGGVKLTQELNRAKQTPTPRATRAHSRRPQRLRRRTRAAAGRRRHPARHRLRQALHNSSNASAVWRRTRSSCASSSRQPRTGRPAAASSGSSGSAAATTWTRP